MIAEFGVPVKVYFASIGQIHYLVILIITGHNTDRAAEDALAVKVYKY